MWSRVLQLMTFLVAAIGGFLAFSFHAMTALPVAESNLQQIEVGDTPAEVVARLGEPTRKEGAGDRWQYSRPHLWTMAYVQFENGHVVQVDVDR